MKGFGTVACGVCQKECAANIYFGQADGLASLFKKSGGGGAYGSDYDLTDFSWVVEPKCNKPTQVCDNCIRSWLEQSVIVEV